MSTAAAGVWAGLGGALTAARSRADGDRVWAALTERVDPVGARPRRRDDVEVNVIETASGVPFAIACNPRDQVYFRLEGWERELLELMDGERSVADLVVARLRSGGELDVEQVTGLVRLLQAGGFVDEGYVDVDAALARALAPRKGVGSRFAMAVRTLQVEWKGAEPFVQWCYRRALRPMFSPVGKALAVLVALGGLVAFGEVLATEGYHVTTQSVGLGLALLLALDLVIVFIHEMGHAVYLVHHGRRVKGAGARIYFGTPAFFIESSDALMMTRGQRIAQSFAGPYFELVAAGVAAIVLVSFPGAAGGGILYRFVVLNYFVLFLNLVPLLELDGYFILSDWLRVPDLRPRSLAFVRHDLWHKLRRRERLTRAEAGLTFYGVIGVAFTILCLFSAVFFWERTFGDLVNELLDAGPLGIAGLVVLVVVFTGPVIRAGFAGVRALRREARRQAARLRFRAERSWRVEAAALLDAQPVFDELAVETLNDLAGRVRLLPVGDGATVVRSGERSDAYYLVRAGSFAVLDDADPERERVIRTLAPGDAFGELGIMTGAPRSATVRATSNGELFVIDKGPFDRLLADRVHLPDLEPTLQDVVELRALGPFRHLAMDELVELRDRGEWVSSAPGDVVVAQGEPGDAFYAVGAGHLVVTENGETMRELGPGAHFGEIALLLDIPRTATVTATTPCRLYRLDRAGFDALIRREYDAGRLRPDVALDRIWHH